MKRTNYSSGAIWEGKVGYSRAVRVGNIIEISGNVASDNDKVVAEGDAYEQTRFVLAKIESALIKAGATLHDVVRTRMFVTDISRWEEFGRAHGEFFKSIKPATTMVEVNKLIDARFLVEVEATAIIEQKA
jgi:enamine deaminase RidA (YjgF/YER057c/UK114 family)